MRPGVRSKLVRLRRRVPVERPWMGCSTMRHRVPMRSRLKEIFMGRPKGAFNSAFPYENTMGVSARWNKGSWRVYGVFGKTPKSEVVQQRWAFLGTTPS